MPTRRLTLARRMVCDFLRAGRHAEPVTFERVMPLADVRAARDEAAPKPAWPVLVAKAAGIAAEACPELRQTFVRFPTARIYEHPTAIAGIVVSKEFAGDECLFVLHLHDPGRKAVADLDARVRAAKANPVSATGAFRRAVRVGKLPAIVRRPAWGLLDWSGAWRVGQLGTFGVSATAGLGAAAVTLRTPWAVAFHYDVFRPDGSLPVRVTFDHRVLDGRVACRILGAVEAALTGPVLSELRAAASASRSARAA